MDVTTITFASPLITVALSAWVLKERVRVYRWSAVAVGFVGVVVMLWPHLDLARYTSGATTAASRPAGDRGIEAIGVARIGDQGAHAGIG